MEVCKRFKDKRKKWLRRYAELERRCEEAEQQEKWDRAEQIGEALIEMEQHAGFQPCFNCNKKDCPAHFDGFAAWDPMDEKLHQVRI